MNLNSLLELLKRYNAGEINLSDEEAQQLAEMAFQMKQNFKTRSKPIRKGLFDLVDTATLGLVPNKWRPTSPGQGLHGESGLDKFAGGVGTIAGLGVPVAGAIGVAKRAPEVYSRLGSIGRSGKDKVMSVAERLKEQAAIKRSVSNARQFYNRNNPFNFDDVLDFSNLGI